MFSFANSCYQSLENYASKRLDFLYDQGTDKLKNRLLFGVSLYPILYLTNRIFAESVPPSFSCPPDLTNLNILEKVVGPTFVTVSFAATGVLEEIFFREILQNHLKDKVSSLLERVSPDLAACWNGTSGKIARIALLTTLFAGGHVVQYAVNGEMAMGVKHALNVVPLCLMTATLQELDNCGSISAMGLHATNNIVRCVGVFHKILSHC